MSDIGDITSKKKRAIVVGNTMVFLAVAYMILATGALLYNSYVGAKTRTIIVDCVESTGDCAKRNARATATVVDTLIKANALDEVATRRVVILAAVCSEEPDIRNEPDQAERIRLMESCVTKELEKEGK